ncbi:MAG: RluA family pseudouridine synthase [bacterium]
MLKVLFENENLIAVDKPCGLQSIPGGKKDEPDLRSQLEVQCEQKLFVVHRLDKEVSGVIVFAKNAETHKYLSLQFEDREVKKKYFAVVHGKMKPGGGVIDQPIRQFGSGRMGIDPGSAKRSLTQFEVVKSSDNFSILNAYPWTGRRHQIRVHLYSIGHAIVGDMIYGEKEIQRNFSRLMLHAAEIEFKNPDGKTIKINSEIPEELKNILVSEPE